MSDIVQKQEKELANQGFRLDKLTDLEEENQMLKEKIQEQRIEIMQIKNNKKVEDQTQLIQNLHTKLAESDKHLRMTLDRLSLEHQRTQALVIAVK